MNKKQWATMTAGLVAAGLMTGCMSAYRLTSNMGISGKVPQTGGAKFNIVSVGFVNPTNVPNSELPTFGDATLESGFDYRSMEQKQPDGTTATVLMPVPNQKHQALLMAAAQKSYPQLFSAEPGAIPIKVTVTRAGYKSETPGHPCISCLTLTIVPMHDQGKTDYTVTTASGDETIDKLLAAPVSFSRTSFSSSSCFIPAAWQPVSGTTAPKITAETATQVAGQLTIDGCVESIVKAIQRVDPGAWARLGTAPKAP